MSERSLIGWEFSPNEIMLEGNNIVGEGKGLFWSIG